jgi:hypothetical protein
MGDSDIIWNTDLRHETFLWNVFDMTNTWRKSGEDRRSIRLYAMLSVIRLALYLQCICHTTGSVSAMYPIIRLALYLQCICNTTGFVSAKETNITAIEECKFTNEEMENICTPYWCSGIVVALVFLYFMDERQGGTWYRSFFTNYSVSIRLYIMFRLSFEKLAYGAHWEVPWAIRGPLTEMFCTYLLSCVPDHWNDVW